MDQVNLPDNEEQSLGKLLVVGLFPVLLVYIHVVMSMFAPFPIALSSVVYGRLRGAMSALIGVLACIILVQFFAQDGVILFIMVSCSFVAFCLAEVVIRQINPLKGIMAIGLIITMIVSAGIVLTVTQTNKSPQELLVIEFEKIQPLIDEQRKKIKEAGGENSFELDTLITQPKLLAEEVLKVGPGYFLMSVLLTLWINLFLLLKSNRLVNKFKNIKYSESYLLNFKVPDEGIWFVIASLALTLWGDKLGAWYAVIGLTGLKTIGVFYFFQGFGIYLAFLDYVNLTGFFRSLLVVLTVFTAGTLLAIVGLADMFIDFKKLMQKKDQGDLK